MDERLAAADAALKAGQGEEAIRQLSALLEADPAQPANVYRTVLLQCYRAGRLEDGVRWGAEGARRYPRDVEILNVLGVCYRRLSRPDEALRVLDAAAKIAPNNGAVMTNRGNVLLDKEDGARAEAVFAKLVRADPRTPENHRQLARALAFQGKRAAAQARMRQAITLKRDYADAWLDLLGFELEEQNFAECDALLEKAFAVFPDDQRFHEARVILLRRSQRLRQAEALLMELLPRFGDQAWLHYQLGGTVADYDRERSNVHLRKAFELDPKRNDHLMALIEGLERTRSGDEGANIEEAYQFTLQALERRLTSPSHLKVMFEVLIRVAAFDDMDRVGDFKTRGRAWAGSGRHTALLKQLAHVKTLEDRYELLEQHRIWARDAQAVADRRPIAHPAPRSPDGKIRLGLMSSDLRSHPVGYFALPLFENLDDRFELYVYSFYQGQHADKGQEYFASRSTFRWRPDIEARDAAQMIADDQLDMLFELGGTTHMNKLEVMAYRPAPRQASWLGYPHSAGLSTIDYLLCDPYNLPPRGDLLIEKPLVMPNCWLSIGGSVFQNVEIPQELPEDRNGHISFGTANNPHKYNRETFALWCEVLQAVPGSTFRFIRPESGTATFRKNVIAEFARHGVTAERIIFSPVRGRHMPFYNEVDITLDPFPLTGGTTTTESLWMGVPVVSLVGEAFFERLSASILTNTGLADLATSDPAEYVNIARRLVADRPRRLALRQGLRTQMKSSPIGQTKQFAADFYDLVAKTVRENR